MSRGRNKWGTPMQRTPSLPLHTSWEADGARLKKLRTLGRKGEIHTKQNANTKSETTVQMQRCAGMLWSQGGLVHSRMAPDKPHSHRRPLALPRLGDSLKSEPASGRKRATKGGLCLAANVRSRGEAFERLLLNVLPGRAPQPSIPGRGAKRPSDEWHSLMPNSLVGLCAERPCGQLLQTRPKNSWVAQSLPCDAARTAEAASLP